MTEAHNPDILQIRFERLTPMSASIYRGLSIEYHLATYGALSDRPVAFLLYFSQIASLLLCCWQPHFILSNHLSDNVMFVSIYNIHLAISMLSQFPDVAHSIKLVLVVGAMPN